MSSIWSSTRRRSLTISFDAKERQSRRNALPSGLYCQTSFPIHREDRIHLPAVIEHDIALMWYTVNRMDLSDVTFAICCGCGRRFVSVLSSINRRHDEHRFAAAEWIFIQITEAVGKGFFRGDQQCSILSMFSNIARHGPGSTCRIWCPPHR